MVNKPLIRPYFWGGSFGGVAKIPMIVEKCWSSQHRQKLPISTQLSDYDRSISMYRVNIRVGGFHLVPLFSAEFSG